MIFYILRCSITRVVMIIHRREQTRFIFVHHAFMTGHNDLKKNNHIYIIFQWPLQFAMQTNWHIYFFCPVMNAWCTNIKSKDLVFIHIGQVQCLLWLFRKTWHFTVIIFYICFICFQLVQIVWSQKKMFSCPIPLIIAGIYSLCICLCYAWYIFHCFMLKCIMQYMVW